MHVYVSVLHACVRACVYSRVHVYVLVLDACMCACVRYVYVSVLHACMRACVRASVACVHVYVWGEATRQSTDFFISGQSIFQPLDMK